MRDSADAKLSAPPVSLMHTEKRSDFAFKRSSSFWRHLYSSRTLSLSFFLLGEQLSSSNEKEIIKHAGHGGPQTWRPLPWTAPSTWTATLTPSGALWRELGPPGVLSSTWVLLKQQQTTGWGSDLFGCLL